MIYIFLGANDSEKDKEISLLKSTFLPNKESHSFDFEILHADKSSSDDIKKALTTLPVLEKQRLVLIRNINKLNKRSKEIIIEFSDVASDQVHLLLDAFEGEQNAFIKKILPRAKLFNYHQAEKQNVFHMTDVMRSGQTANALKILNELMDKGNHPLAIMGGLVWFWGKKCQRLPREKFKQGLAALQQADLNIKRSRLKPEYAMEAVVVKLCLLLA